MSDTAHDLDLGSFEDDVAALATKPEVVGAAVAEDDDLSKAVWDLASGDVALDALNETAPADVDAIFAEAKLAAMNPKPTLQEMIAAICDAANRLEDGQRALMRAGVRREPHAPYMRQAAILDAAQKFLLLVDTKRDAVKRVLRGG